MSGGPREIELKLRLPRGEATRLLAHPALRGLKRGRARTEALLTTYYDTASGVLAADGIALRIRRGGRRTVQTLKVTQAGDTGGGLADRIEHEWPLPRGDAEPAPDLGLLVGTPIAKRVARATQGAAVEARFTTDFRRTTVPLAFPDGTRAILCVDVGEIRGPAPDRSVVPICEVEVELEDGAPARLFDLALALLDDLPLEVEAASKAERGHALATGANPRPVTAEDVRLADGIDAAGAIGAIVRNCLRQIEANADGLLAGDDPEWIHQMRVGVRRMRSCLALVRRLVPPAVLGHVDVDLRWLASALAPARDLDVFTLEALPALRDAARHAPPGATAIGPVLAQLAEHAHARLADARRDARAAVASKRFHRLLLASGALATTPRLGVPEGSAEAAMLAQPATTFAASLLARRHRKLRKRLAGIAGMSPAERHEVRILAKRLRYATEFFTPLFSARRARAYRKTLAALQGILGEQNDAAVAAALAAELGNPASPSAALFAGWAAARGAAAEKSLDRAAREFARASPFWK
jgi:inorganic triphosphatase YgiF